MLPLLTRLPGAHVSPTAVMSPTVLGLNTSLRVYLLPVWMVLLPNVAVKFVL